VPLHPGRIPLLPKLLLLLFRKDCAAGGFQA